MTFQLGNKLWALTERPTGAPRKFETDEDLLEKIIEYFEWAAENPIEETVIGWYQGEVTEHIVEHERALSIRGLCVFLGISNQLWSLWKRETDRCYRQDFVRVQEWAEHVMFEQKFANAVAGLFNASIIARDLGLVEKQELAGPGGVQLPTQIILASAVSVKASSIEGDVSASANAEE